MGKLSEALKAAGKAARPAPQEMHALVSHPESAQAWVTTNEQGQRVAKIATPQGEHEFHIIDLPDGMSTIDYPELPKRERGRGLGSMGYREAIRDTEARGRTFVSGAQVSPRARNIYKGLENRGYEVRTNPNAKNMDEPARDGFHGAEGDDPLFIVKAPDKEWSFAQGVAKNFAAPVVGATGLLALGANRDEAGAGPLKLPHLPMDEASRMARAREQGFNVEQPLFHGTDRDFGAFRDGANTYLSPHPELASMYATGDAGRVMPLLARNGERVSENSVIVRKPNDIRSRFAEFDPDASDSSDLLAGLGLGGAGIAGALALNPQNAEAARLPRVPKQPKLPTTTWAEDEARSAEREARRAKGAVLRGDIAQSSADARDIFGGRLNFPGDDELVVARQQRGPIPHVTRPGRLAPGSIKLEALAKLNEHPTITRPGMPEGAHAVDPRALAVVLGGGATAAGAGFGFMGPPLVADLKASSRQYVQGMREDNAIDDMRAQTRALYDALAAYRGAEGRRGGTLKAPADTVGSVTSNLLMGRPAYGAKRTIGQDISGALDTETDKRMSEGGLLGAFRAFPTAILSDVFADPAAWADPTGIVADPLRYAFSNRVGRGKGELERMRAQAR